MVRGPISMVIVGAIMLVMMALTMGGPRVFENVLPEKAIVWIETMGMGTMEGGWTYTAHGTLRMGGGKAPTADPDDPNSRLRDSSDGWSADVSVATLQGGGLAWVEDVIDGHRTRVHGHAPGTVTPLTEVQGCAFTPPTALAHVGHAASGERVQIDLGTYNDSHIAAAVQTLVNVYRDSGTVRSFRAAGPQYDVFDIALTETARPVYLVLVAGAGQPVFNIHLAPGARIERVALIGGDQTGVANLPEDVPVEVMRRPLAESCGAVPFYPLNPGALYYQSVENGAIRAEEVPQYEARFAAAEAAWEGFFRANFGVSARESLSGDVRQVMVAAIGPVPDDAGARAVWQPIKGAPVRVTMDQYVDYPDMPEGQDFDSRVQAVARAFAWGDIANLSTGVDF